MASDPTEQGPDHQFKAKVFVSYSRKDLVFANRLDAALKAQGFETLIDRSEIYAFEDWWKRIQALIGQADTVIFVISPDAVASEVCAKEVAFAASLNKRFAPIVVRRVDDKQVPEPLARLNFIFFDDEALFSESLSRLCTALATDIDWIRKHTEYGEAARDWAAAGRPAGLQLRSPALEQAERWIGSRPYGAPAPTEETQAFVTDSRRGATRRRNVLTGSLAAGLVLALLLAGIAYWQRGVAVEQRQIADQQRERAERTLTLATRTTNSLVFDLAQKFRDVVGVPTGTVKDILERARQLQDQLLGSGESSPQLRFSQAVALGEVSTTLLALGETESALAAAKQDLDIFQSLVAQAPDNSDFQLNLSVAYYDVGNVQLVQEDLAAALASYQASRTIRERLATSNPANTEWQHRLADVYDRIGQVYLDQLDLAAALTAYRTAHEIVVRLAQAEPDNAGWQGDLEVSYEKLGYVQLAQGDLPEALNSYQQRLAITERLARADPTNAHWQRDLYLAHASMGDVEMAQGKLPAALSSYQTGLAIIERLAGSDPGNKGWQRDLALAHVLLGNAQRAQGDLGAALGSYQTSLDISKRLASTDPANSDWQDDMSITSRRIGDVQMAQGNLSGALASYQASLAMGQRLAKAKATDHYQYGVKETYDKIGAVQMAQGDPAAALASYQASLAIMVQLANGAPGNGDRQWELAGVYDRLGNVQMALSDLPAALASYQSQLAIMQRLTTSDPGNTAWRRDLFVAYVKLGDVQTAQSDLSPALASYQSSLDVMQALAKSNPGNAGWQRDWLTATLRVGQALFNLGRIEEALKRYDDAIQIGTPPDLPAIYLRRTIAELASGDAVAAAKDAASALKLAPNEAYYVLWLHVARMHANQPDADEFTTNGNQIDRGKWPAPVVALFLGTATFDDVKNAAASAEPPSARVGRACEADFFIGIYHVERNDAASARPSLQSAVDHCPHGFFEYTAAKFELARLDSLSKTRQQQ